MKEDSMADHETKSAGLTRRGFLKTAGLGAAAAAGLASVPAAGISAALAAPDAGAPAVMPRRKLGKTGVEVPILNLGGMFDTINNQLMLKQAVNWGLTYWDTAEAYGNGQSEEGMGRFLGKNPDKRKDMFIVTKLVLGKGDLETRFTQALKRLQTSYVDLFYVHGISGLRDVTPETLAWLKKTKESGRAKFIGFSTHTNMADCLSAAPAAGWVDVIMFTYNFRVMAVDACHKAGIGLVAMKTMGMGPQVPESPAELKMLDAFLKRGFSDKQAKLKAVWADERIATICSQMPNLTILSANVAAAWDLTALAASDFELLRQYAHETKTGYCAGCSGACGAAMGGVAPVNEVMRCLMYYHDYKEPTLARDVFAGLPESFRENLDRLDFAPAERACPQGLAIAQLMRQAGELLA
jgi:predicted aldo/keto reductase-like oxidoreductase